MATKRITEARLEQIGIRASQFVGKELRAASLRSFKRRKFIDLEPIVKKLQPTLLRGFVAWHMLGVKRARAAAGIRLAAGDSAARAYDEVISVLTDLTNLTEKEVEKLYLDESFAALSGIAETIQSELEATLGELISDGATTKTAINTLQEKYTLLGVGPQNPFLLETQYRTAIQTATSAGQFIINQDPDVDEIIWGYTYVTAGDDRVRPEHAELDGTTLPKDSPFWQVFWPPNGWNCRCQVITLFEPTRIKTPGELPELEPRFATNPGARILTLAT